MAVDMFLKLEPIKGEATDSKHKDEIDVLSFNWGLNQTGSQHHSLGGGAGKVTVHDLHFTHWADKSTAYLIKACTKGEHIQKGILTVRKAGGDQALEYIKITMEDIIVSSVTPGGTMGDERLTENVSLNFRKFKYEYTAQTEKGGGGATAQFHYDIAGNKEL
jgi:type VI secretion system secreted protein Hcp